MNIHDIIQICALTQNKVWVCKILHHLQLNCVSWLFIGLPTADSLTNHNFWAWGIYQMANHPDEILLSILMHSRHNKPSSQFPLQQIIPAKNENFQRSINCMNLSSSSIHRELSHLALHDRVRKKANNLRK